MNEQSLKQEYPFPIVGIGASAGGLAALESFFKNAPADTGMAFVIVQHLSHDFKSLMDTLLARYTDMPINIITEGMRVRPNQVFLIPSGTFLTIENLVFRLEKYNTEKVVLRYPIDQFFSSLAHDARDKAVGVILSGAGSDGSRGIVDIHKVGGLVLVQDEESARFDAMPMAGFETGITDLVISPNKMCQVIQDVLNGRFDEAEIDNPETVEVITADNAFSIIIGLLQKRFNVDFTHYKMPTVLRRIERRMQIANIEAVELYVAFLNENGGELDNLYRDILVDVTRFFRDPEAFEWFENEGILNLLESKNDGETVRVWIAGCATGEEAYSITTLIYHLIKENKRDLDLKVFATDLHQDSIRRATLGVFDSAAAKDIPEHIFKKYFYIENDRLYVETAIRKKIIFAPHDLLNDSPFTNLDLISCRNVLIYMETNAQQKVLHQFHFGLNKNGILFLGPSEYLGALSNDFTSVNRMWRIYSKNSNRRLIDVTNINLTRSNQLRTGRASQYSVGNNGWEVPLLTRFIPDSILVDQQWYLLRTFGKGVRYLTLPTGRVDLLITRLINPSLVTPLRAALYRAGQEKSPTLLERVQVKLKGETTTVELKVIPIVDSDENWQEREERTIADYYLISLNEIENSDQWNDVSEHERTTELVINSNEVEYIEELERELMFSRESLQATIEELETTNEELQSSNEELLAANEELQSTNEELHSVNEELYTVNSEYILQNEQLVKLHEDIQSLQRSSHTISIYLDSDQKIKEFSQDAGELFGLLPHDNGRPFANLRLFENLSNKILEKLINDSLTGKNNNLHIIQDNIPYLLEIMPHQAYDSTEIEGVIFKLLNVSGIFENQGITFGNSWNTKNTPQINPVMIFVYDIQAQLVLYVNNAVRGILGVSPSRIQSLPEGEFISQYIHPDDQAQMHQKIIALDEAPAQTVIETRVRMKHADGSWRWISSKERMFTRSGSGKLVQYIGSAIDITENVANEERVKQLENELLLLKEKSVKIIDEK